MTMMPFSYDSETAQVLEEAERLKLNCQHTESLALLEVLLSRDPANVAALEEVADNELSLEHYDRAVAAATRAVVLDAESYMGHYILGYVASLRQEWKSAQRELELANRKKPRNPEILRCLGWTLFQKGKRVQGIVTLERALNLDRENVLTLCDLGVCYLHVGNYHKAQALFEHALSLDPTNDRARECVEMVTKLGRKVRQ